MIRRTLINRARRQRDLARTLIARHSLMAYGHSQPQLGYRPAVLSDDFFAFASSAEAAAPVPDEIVPPASDLGVLLAALPEEMSETEAVLFNPAQSVAPALEAMIAPEHVPDVAEPVPASAVTSVQPAVAADQRAGNTLADLVRRMRDPAWVAPEAGVPATTTPASAPVSAAPKPTASQHVADLVRRMRDSAWVAPEAGVPATTTPVSAALKPTASQQVTDLVHQMQERPQRTTFRAERPRIPLGQRMSEAADFGQTPATPHHVDQLAAPAQDEPPAEAAAGQPAQVVFETEHPANERSGGDVGHASEPIQPVESAGWLPIIVGANAVTVAPMLTSESPDAVAAHPDAPAPNPRAPLNKAEPPTEHRALSQKLQTNATLAAAAAILPSQAPAAAIANSLQNLDAPVALPPPATSDLLSPVDIPPATTNDLERPVANVDQIDTASRRVTPAVEYPRQALDLPPVQPSDAHTQPALAAFAAGARATSPIAPDQPMAAARPTPNQPKPSTQAPTSVETIEPHGATTELPLPPEGSASDPIAAATPASLGQMKAIPTWPVESESQLPSSEASTLAVPAQVPNTPALDTARIRYAPSEIDRESQPAALRQPESGLSQVQSLSLLARSAEPVALPRAPTNSVEPPADSQRGGAQPPNAERASAPQEAAESAFIAPDHDSPQAWAARLSPPNQPLSAHIADTARPVSEPNVVQQHVSNPDNRIEIQLDVNLPAAKSSADVPIAEQDPVAPAHEHIQAIDQHATHVEARISLPVLNEHAPVLDQGLQVPRSDAAATEIDTALPRKREPLAKAAETPLARSSNAAQEPGAIAPATPPSQSAAEHAPVSTTTVSFGQEPRSELPSQDRRSPTVHEFPVAADDVPTADTPAPGSPQAWAARLAFHRRAAEPPPEPAAARTPVTLIGQPATQAAPAMDAGAESAIAPGSPQAWAARFARHRQMTEPQANPTAARTPAALPAAPAPTAPIESQALRAAPDRSATAIADPTPGTPARFVPARRANPGTVSAVPVDAQTAATKRAPVAHDATTTVDVPVVTVPEPGSPQVWAARFARHRQMTEPQAGLNPARVPVTGFDQPTLPAPTPVGADAPAAPEPGSPQAWAARLFPQAQPASPQIPPNARQPSALQIAQRDVPAAPPATVQPPRQVHRVPDIQPQITLRHAAPTPMTETTRRFLQPLVGIDPAQVRVFRGPVANQVTAGYQADALASGDIVALAAEHSEDTPATLGVLAHELTHIARQRDSRFIPPLARREHMPGATNEESLAQSVESQVRRIARGQAEATRRAPAPLNAASGRAMPASAPIAAPAQPRPNPPDTQPLADDADWGGLPAPWDPLPQWLNTPTSAEMPTPTAPQPARSMPPAQPAATRNDAPFAPPVQLAETGRMLDALPAQSSPATTPAQQPAPDLDALARQVYSVLKQRLAAEHRRSQS